MRNNENEFSHQVLIFFNNSHCFWCIFFWFARSNYFTGVTKDGISSSATLKSWSHSYLGQREFSTKIESILFVKIAALEGHTSVMFSKNLRSHYIDWNSCVACCLSLGFLQKEAIECIYKITEVVINDINSRIKNCCTDDRQKFEFFAQSYLRDVHSFLTLRWEGEYGALQRLELWSVAGGIYLLWPALKQFGVLPLSMWSFVCATIFEAKTLLFVR